jgi:transposase
MYILGIDLATRAVHRAILANEQGDFVSPVLKFRTRQADLEGLEAELHRRQQSSAPLRVVMEATDIVWYPLAIFFKQRGATVHVVTPQLSAALGEFYHHHAHSDRLAAETLARLPLVLRNHPKLYPWFFSGPDYRALQRGCRELERLVGQISARKNRLQATDHLGWPDLAPRDFAKAFGPAARWFREHYYNPHQVVAVGESGLRHAWRQAAAYDGAEDWIAPLHTLAQELLWLYGAAGTYLDYEALAAAVSREQRRLRAAEQEAHAVRLHVTRPLYRKLHPSRHLETLKGVGQDGAAVYTGFIGQPERFPNTRRFRGWHGMIPRSAQSGTQESKGLRISQAGPNPVKKFAYLNAEVARRWDPQIAALYYEHLVHKGHHHNQAVCACATHLLDRVLVILREDRPYELRAVDGTPVTVQEARALIKERYQVPDNVRRRNTKRARTARAQRRAERSYQRRRSRSS